MTTPVDRRVTIGTTRATDTAIPTKIVAVSLVGTSSTVETHLIVDVERFTSRIARRGHASGQHQSSPRYIYARI